MQADEASAQLEALLEEIAATERRAAIAVARCDDANSRRESAIADKQRVAERTRAAQTACRELQRLNAQLEVDGKRMEADCAARRAETEGKFESAVADIAARMEEQAAEAVKVGEENAKSATTLERFEEQHAAAARHREAEVKAKTLECRLYAARLAEADGMLSEVSAKNEAASAALAAAAERVAAQRRHVDVCEAKWAELDSTLAKTAAAVAEYEEQAADATAKADGYEAERHKLAGKVNGFEAKRAALNAQVESLEAAIVAKGAERAAAMETCRELQQRRKAMAAAAGDEPAPAPPASVD